MTGRIRPGRIGVRVRGSVACSGQTLPLSSVKAWMMEVSPIVLSSCAALTKSLQCRYPRRAGLHRQPTPSGLSCRTTLFHTLPHVLTLSLSGWRPLAAVAPSSGAYPRNVVIPALTSGNVEAACGLVETWAQVPDDNIPSATDRVAIEGTGIFLRYAVALRACF